MPGAIDFLLACNFAYVTVLSSSSSSSSLSSSSRPLRSRSNNAIQLTKEREDRIVLLFGRIYLHKFGKRILDLGDDKDSNELPPLKGFRDIAEHMILQNAGDNAEALVKDTIIEDTDCRTAVTILVKDNKKGADVNRITVASPEGDAAATGDTITK